MPQQHQHAATWLRRRRWRIPRWLAGDFHEAWTAALQQGKRPALSRNGSGWHVRAYSFNGNEGKKAGEEKKNNGAESRAEETEEESKTEDTRSKGPKPFDLEWFTPLRSGRPAAAEVALREALPAPHRQRDGRARRHRQDLDGHGRGDRAGD